MSLRRVAMLVAMALHGKEERCVSFLSELGDPSKYDLLDSIPIAPTIPMGNRLLPGVVSYASGEVKALSTVLMRWSNPDYIRLLNSEVKGIKLLAIFLLQHLQDIDDRLWAKIQKLRSDEDDSIRAYATQLVVRMKSYGR